MNNLFELIGESYLPNAFGNFPPEVKAEIYFSDALQLYIEISTNGVWFLKPMEHINDLDEITCGKIRESHLMKPNEKITWFNLYSSGYVHAYLLDGPIQTEEPKESLFELIANATKP